MISIDSKVTATIALEADDEILIQRLLERGKQVVELMIKMKIKSEIATRNTMRTAPLMQYYNDQGKFYAVNGIGSIQEITARLSTVIDNL
jgi:adenylate kinase